MFARNGANQREVGFREDVGVRMRWLRGRFAVTGQLAALLAQQHDIAVMLQELEDLQDQCSRLLEEKREQDAVPASG